MWPWRWAASANRTRLARANPGCHNGPAISRGGPMTNTLSLVLGTLLVGAIAVDALANDGASLLFLGKKLADLIEWLAFWR